MNILRCKKIRFQKDLLLTDGPVIPPFESITVDNIYKAKLVLITNENSSFIKMCLATGVFLVSYYDLETYYQEGKDWVKYKGPETIDYYLKNYHEAQRIADSGYRSYQKTVCSEESKYLKDRKYFFILGSQRTGTTLMELMIGSHDGITVFGEPGAYQKLENRNPTPYDKVLGFKIPSWTHKVSYFDLEYPNAYILFMKRDLIQIVASMVSLKEWIQKALDIELSNALLEYPPYKDLDEQIKRNDILRCTLCAMLNQNYYELYKRRGFNVHQVEYEQLVNKPEQIMEETLNFLGIEWDDKVLRHPDFHNGIYTGRTNSKRPVDTQSLDKWKSVLSSDQTLEIMDFVRTNSGSLYHQS